MPTYADDAPGVYTIRHRDAILYVGQSLGIRNRIRQHRTKLRSGKHENHALQERFNNDPQGWGIVSVHIIPEKVVKALDKQELKLLLLNLERETIQLITAIQDESLLNER